MMLTNAILAVIAATQLARVGQACETKADVFWGLGAGFMLAAAGMLAGAALFWPAP